MGPREGGSPGARGRAEPQELGRRLGRRPGVSARRRRSNQALPTCLSVGMSVCAPGQRNRAEPHGKRASLTCSRLQRLESKTGAQSPGLPRGPAHCAESHGYSQGPLVQAEQEARATAAVSSLASSSKPIPERSPRSLAAWEAPGQSWRAGGPGGGAAAGGRRGVLFGYGKARRGSGLGWGPSLHPTLQAAPRAGHPGSAPCLLPPGSAWSFCKPRWGSDSRGLRITGSLGDSVEGYRREESIFMGKGGTAGVLCAEFGVMIGRRHSSMTLTKKKW